MNVTLTELFATIGRYLLTIEVSDVLDIAIMAFALYKVLTLVQTTKAASLLKGLFVFLAALLLSYLFGLNGIYYLLSRMVEVGVLALIILFQPEIRKALEQVGRSKVGQSLASAVGARDNEAENAETRKAISGVVEATAILQQLRMGALIVFERSTRLGEIIETGTLVDAGPAGQLIANIFFNKAPLHDGGMIIREGRICAAGCILPLTSSNAVSAELGTRHRAALGMSENSDAVVVVVSEETGQISIATGGRLTRNFSRVTLAEALERELVGEPAKRSQGRILGRLGLGKTKKRRQ